MCTRVYVIVFMCENLCVFVYMLCVHEHLFVCFSEFVGMFVRVS